MKENNILSILVIIFFVSSILSVTSLLFAVNKTTISGQATASEGSISLTVNAPEGEPEPGPITAPTTGGIGGGGGTTEERSKIIVTPEKIKTSVKVNEISKQRLTVTNIGRKSTQVTAEVIAIKDILGISQRSFLLNPGENKVLVLEIFTEEPGGSTGQLVISTKDQRIVIPIIIEAETQQVLFDLSIDLKPKTLHPGEELSVFATLFNLYEVGLVDVNIKYSIKDFTNNIILEKEETITMENQATFSKTFTLPKSIKPEEHVLIVQATHGETVGTASESFLVIKVETPKEFNIYYVLIPLTILLIILILILMYKKRSLISQQQQISEKIVRKMIKKYLKDGHTKEEIKAELISKDWPEDKIDKMLK